MGWTVWGNEFSSGELANTAVYQNIKFNSAVYLKAIRTWIIVYGDPVFTNLGMKIYSTAGSSGTPGLLLETSSTILTKAQIITDLNGVKEIYFEFNDFPVQENTWYSLVMYGAGYLPTANSHLAWMKAFPDAVYQTNLPTAYMTKLITWPLAVYGIGSEL